MGKVIDHGSWDENPEWRPKEGWTVIVGLYNKKPRNEAGKPCGVSQFEIKGTPEQIANVMDYVGYGLQQTQVIGINRSQTGNAYSVDIIQVAGNDLAVPDAAMSFWRDLRAAGAPAEMVAGFYQVVRGGQPGIRLLNLEGPSDASQIEDLKRVLVKVAEKRNFDVDLDHGSIALISSKNDWTKEPNGEGYRSRILGRKPGIETERELDHYSRSVQQKISEYHQ